MTHFIPILTQECEGNSSRVRVVSDENKTLCHHILNCTLSEPSLLAKQAGKAMLAYVVKAFMKKSFRNVSSSMSHTL